MRLRTPAVALAVAALLGTSSVVASDGIAAAQPAVPHVSADGWTQLSNGKISIIQNVGVGRFDTSLQLVWVEDAGTQNNLVTRIVGSDGQPLSAPTAVQSGWAAINTYPVVIANGGHRLISFSGLQDTNSSNPYSQGYQYFATSDDGTSWTLSQGAMSSRSLAYGSYGTDAVDAGGTPVLAYTAGSADAISYHSGLLATIPATSVDDPETTPAAHCCTYRTGLGYDATSQSTWAVWYSNSRDASTDGILAQQVAPSVGTQSQAPGSSTLYAGDINSIDPGQRIATAARVGGGVFAGYGIGYPTMQKVALWKLGGAGALKRSAGGSVGRVGVAAGPDGRVWLFWWDSHSSTIRFARSNPQVSRLGATCKVATPGATTEVWNLVGNASRGPLQLVVLAGESNPQIYDKVLRPCLSVGLSRSKISAAKGGSFTVTVSDAGSAVAGAKVRFDGHTRSTSSAGKVSFTVAKHHRTGKLAVKVSRAGYQSQSAKVRIK